MNETWNRWVQENIESGCKTTEIIEILQKNRFAQNDIITSLVAHNADMRGLEYLFSEHPFYRISITNHPMVTSHASEKVQLFTIDDFLHPSECLWLISAIEHKLQPSELTIEGRSNTFRTSQTSHLNLDPIEAEMRMHIENRISMLLGIPPAYGEQTQGQKYTLGQEFKAHTDTFEPGSEEFNTFAHDLGQRTWTCMIYLNDTPKGGKTRFTKLDIAFSPKMGQALIWNNLKEDGTPNPYTTHHGMPVLAGEKYIITKWFRENSNL